MWGDIKVFSLSTDLYGLRCQRTQIGSDVQVFQQHARLNKIDLSFANVKGKISVFANKVDLRRLNLAYARVFGDIGVLLSEEIANAFRVLDLSATRTVGNIWLLQNAKSLEELYLADTQWNSVSPTMVFARPLNPHGRNSSCSPFLTYVSERRLGLAPL